MTDQPPTAPVVEMDDTNQQYDILVNGKRAGFAAYVDRGGQRVFIHTEIDDAYARQGLAARLVEHTLTETRAAGKRIVPVCPYVARFLKKHDEYADVTDPVTPDLLRWLENGLG